MEATNPSHVLTFWDLQLQKLLKNNKPFLLNQSLFLWNVLLYYFTKLYKFCVLLFIFIQRELRKNIVTIFLLIKKLFQLLHAVWQSVLFLYTFLCDSSITFIHLYASFWWVLLSNFYPKTNKMHLNIRDKNLPIPCWQRLRELHFQKLPIVFISNHCSKCLLNRTCFWKFSSGGKSPQYPAPSSQSKDRAIFSLAHVWELIFGKNPF